MPYNLSTHDINFSSIDLFRNSIYGFPSSDSATRLKEWKYDELQNSSITELAKQELITTYYTHYSGIVKEHVAASSYLCAPLSPEPPIGLSSAILRFYPNTVFSNQIPLSYTNDMIIGIQSGYKRMDNDVRRNIIHPTIPNGQPGQGNRLPGNFSTFEQNDSGSGLNLPIPYTSINTLAGLLDLSAGSAKFWDYYPDMLRLASGIPVASGAGPVLHTLKQIWLPTSFSRSIALYTNYVSSGVDSPDYKIRPETINFTPVSGQNLDLNSVGHSGLFPSGNLAHALVYFGTSIDEPIDINLTISANNARFKIYDWVAGSGQATELSGVFYNVDSPHYDFGQKQVLNNDAKTRHFHYLRIRNNVSDFYLKDDASGLYENVADTSFNSPYIRQGEISGILNYNFTIHPTGFKYRTVPPIPNTITERWRDFMVPRSVADLSNFFYLQLDTDMHVIADNPSGTYMFGANYVDFASSSTRPSISGNLTINNINVPFIDSPKFVYHTGPNNPPSLYPQTIHAGTTRHLRRESWEVCEARVKYGITAQVTKHKLYEFDALQWQDGVDSWQVLGWKANSYNIPVVSFYLYSKDLNGNRFGLLSGGIRIATSGVDFNSLESYNNVPYGAIGNPGGAAIHNYPLFSHQQKNYEFLTGGAGKYSLAYPFYAERASRLSDNIYFYAPPGNFTFAQVLNLRDDFFNNNTSEKGELITVNYQKEYDLAIDNPLSSYSLSFPYELWQNIGVSFYKNCTQAFPDIQLSQGQWREWRAYDNTGGQVPNYSSVNGQFYQLIPHDTDTQVAIGDTTPYEVADGYTSRKALLTINYLTIRLKVRHRKYSLDGQTLTDESQWVDLNIPGGTFDNFTHRVQGDINDLNLNLPSVLGSWWN